MNSLFYCFSDVYEYSTQKLISEILILIVTFYRFSARLVWELRRIVSLTLSPQIDDEKGGGWG